MCKDVPIEEYIEAMEAMLEWNKDVYGRERRKACTGSQQMNTTATTKS